MSSTVRNWLRDLLVPFYTPAELRRARLSALEELEALDMQLHGDESRTDALRKLAESARSNGRKRR
jgi:hypothetical protein